MIEKFTPTPKKETINYVENASLPTLRERPLDYEHLPAPIEGAIQWLNTTQGPFDFMDATANTNNILLANADESVFLAVRIVLDDNSVDGLAADTESRTARFYSNQLPSESFMEVSLLSDERESAATIGSRLAAIQEFSLNKCVLSVYSQPHLSAHSLRVWSELEAEGKAKRRLMPNGETRFFLL